MAYSYDVKSKRSGINKNDVKYYAIPKRTGVVTTRQLAKIISERCTLTEPDMVAALSALSKVLEEYLVQGYHVKLDNIGRFSLSVTSDGMQTPEQVTASHVKAKKICLMADKELKLKTANVEFKRKSVK